MIRLTLAFVSFCLLLQAKAQDGKRALDLFNAAKYDSALIYVNRAIESYPSELPSLYKLKADILSYQNDLTTSIDFYRKAIAEVQSSDLRDLSILNESYSGIGFNYGYMGLYEKGIEYTKIGLSYALQLDNKVEISTAYYNLSTYFTRLSQYDSAIMFVMKSYEIDVASGDSTAISSDLNTLGFLYGRMNNFPKALEYHQKSIEFLKPHEKNKLASRFNNLGMIQMQMKRYIEAEVNISKSLALHTELNDSLKIAQRKQNLGVLYVKMNSLDRAQRLLNQALQYYVSSGNKYFEATARVQLAEIFVTQKRNEQAISELEKSIQLSNEANNMETIVESYGMLVSLYESAGRARNALDALKKQKFYEDSLKSNEKLAELGELELKFVTEQKEKEIELLEVSNQLKAANLEKTQRSVLLLIICLVIFIIAAVWIIITQKQTFRLKEEILSKEKDNLRYQINALLGTGSETIQVGLDEVNEKLKERLSEREFDILKLAITEKSNKEIANDLFVSVNTVKFHLKNIYEKLGVSNRKEALQFVIKE